MGTTRKSSVSGGSAPFWAWMGLALAIVLADQFIKTLVLGYLREGQFMPVTSFFNLVLAHNRGAAFSFLAAAGGWQRWLFTGIGLAAAIFMIAMLWRHGRERLFSFALACVLGGAVGNVTDRLIHGFVVDYLDFHQSGWHFPAFNLADSAITIGAALLIFDEFRRARRSK